MTLTELLKGVEVRKILGETRREIEGIAYHSKQVKEGFLFAALRGLEADGHRFIGAAIERGAEVILLEEEEKALPHATMILVSNSRQALARISSNFYGNPSSHLALIGITGTNGKTTTAYLLESILKRSGRAVGVLGTINYRHGEKVVKAVNTTPESLDLQRILGEMVNAGVSHVVMEASSHGLDLDRVYGCQFDGAVFTNFTSDHLDYHKTLGHYFESKKKLFSRYLTQSAKERRFAVTNSDDPMGEAIVDGVPLPVIHYGQKPSCEVSADRVSLAFHGISCQIRTPKGSFPVHSKLIGGFNLENILAAVSAGVGLDLSLQALKEGVEAVEGVSGRLEKVENQKGIHVIVDYAHTRDALERTLLALRSVRPESSPRGGLPTSSSNRGRLITVFGCGGDRDRTKRPLMGEVAGRYSDLSIVTSDNPRTEDPLAIIREVKKGLEDLGLKQWRLQDLERWRTEKGYLVVPDRREAIRMAIRLAEPSDMVLMAGKGHEDYQILGKERFPFDDRVEARKALEEA